MVIEYIGDIIRSEVAEKREKQYEAAHRGIYMFRLDSDYILDATITGGPARYVYIMHVEIILYLRSLIYIFVVKLR